MDDPTSATPMKPLRWVGTSKEELDAFPREARREAGYALYLAQIGMKAVKAKPLKGFGGAGVLEVVVDHDGNTYRAVYTVKFSKIVYVLHAFQKKSKKGTATPMTHLAIIKGRLKLAAEQYRQEFKE
ncbi:MAG TPA: type II toxin-antitoxin system RelE/ParE family toxin [Pirellulales bacterium]|nr:type II toxin-antitoxin system RelE/ParE family toxin [Pirellulales bacterium]